MIAASSPSGDGRTTLTEPDFDDVQGVAGIALVEDRLAAAVAPDAERGADGVEGDRVDAREERAALEGTARERELDRSVSHTASRGKPIPVGGTGLPCWASALLMGPLRIVVEAALAGLVGQLVLPGLTLDVRVASLGQAHR